MYYYLENPLFEIEKEASKTIYLSTSFIQIMTKYYKNVIKVFIKVKSPRT